MAEGNGVTAWSYSRYADYKQCPLKFKLKHIEKRRTAGSPQMERGSTIHKMGETFLKTPLSTKGKVVAKLPPEYVHFKEEMAQLATLDPIVEAQWGFTRSWTPTGWFNKDTWLRIVTDVTVVYDDNTADIIDFKTGRKYDTNQEQMDLFSCGPFMMFPNVNEVTTRLWYLDQPTDNEVEQTFTRADFDKIVKQWEKRILPMFKDKKFAPTPNDKCKWCDFSKVKGGPCVY